MDASRHGPETLSTQSIWKRKSFNLCTNLGVLRQVSIGLCTTAQRLI